MRMSYHEVFHHFLNPNQEYKSMIVVEYLCVKRVWMNLLRVESVAGSVRREPTAKRSKDAEVSSTDSSRLGINMNTYYVMIQGVNDLDAEIAFS